MESTTKFAMILKMKLEASLEYSQKDIDQNKVELEAKVWSFIENNRKIIGTFKNSKI